MRRFSERPFRSSMISKLFHQPWATGLREPLAGKQGRGDFHLGRKVIGMHAEIRNDCRVRCVGIWRDLVFSGTEFAECSRQRPCGQYRFGGLRMPYRAVHDRTRHAFRHVCAHGEDFVPHRIGREKSNWIDFNAGTLLEGEPMPTVLERFTSFVLDVASGRQTLNEENGYHEIAIFKSGVTL